MPNNKAIVVNICHERSVEFALPTLPTPFEMNQLEQDLPRSDNYQCSSKVCQELCRKYRENQQESSNSNQNAVAQLNPNQNAVAQLIDKKKTD